jgi:lipopolysaccharide transport system permease protein
MISTLHTSIELAKRELKLRYNNTVLGKFWFIIWPAVNIFIYTVIFSKVLGAKIPGSSHFASYGLYLAAGIIPWTLFTSILIRTSSLFIDYKNFLLKTTISIRAILSSIVLVELFLFFINLLIYLVVYTLLERQLTFINYTPYLILAILSLLLLAVSIGFLLGILRVFIGDVGEVIQILLQIWFWFTPIVYVETILPHLAQYLVRLNLVYYPIYAFQNSFIFQVDHSYTVMFLVCIIALTVFIFTTYLYQKLKKDIKDLL